MSEIIETDKATGVTLVIEHDDDLMQPESDGVKIAILHRNYINPAQDELPDQEAIQALEDKATAGEAPWAAYPLYLFDHSGTTYRVGDRLTQAGKRPENPFGNGMYAQFDSGRVGTMFLKIGDEGFTDPDQAAKSWAAEYTAWANGYGFGFVVKDKDGEQLDSCWGFLGDEGRTRAIEEGRAMFAHAVTEAAAADAKDAASLEAAQHSLTGAIERFGDKKDFPAAKLLIRQLIHYHHMLDASAVKQALELIAAD